jgi:hypothetical protein
LDICATTQDLRGICPIACNRSLEAYRSRMLKNPFATSSASNLKHAAFRVMGRSSGSPKQVRALIVVAAFLLFSLTSDADLLQAPLISGETCLSFGLCLRHRSNFNSIDASLSKASPGVSSSVNTCEEWRSDPNQRQASSTYRLMGTDRL